MPPMQNAHKGDLDFKESRRGELRRGKRIPCSCRCNYSRPRPDAGPRGTRLLPFTRIWVPVLTPKGWCTESPEVGNSQQLLSLKARLLPSTALELVISNLRHPAARRKLIPSPRQDPEARGCARVPRLGSLVRCQCDFLTPAQILYPNIWHILKEHVVFSSVLRTLS